MPIDPQVLRAAMRNWATGVTVVTSAYDGQFAGATVSSFTSVALEPPTVLVCLNKTTFVHDIMRKSGIYAVSLLAADQQQISNRFAGFDPTVTDRFEGLDLIIGETGAPFIGGALAWLDCQTKHTLDTGTHTIYVAEVIDVRVNSEALPLVYHNRTYKQIVDTVRITD
jgi:flavin reductase (DIM6/NTAB) family NADH-FMN oxidoreductase RutF